MTRKLPECLDKEEVKDIMKQLTKVMKFDLDTAKCFHNKPFASFLHSMKETCSQLPQATQVLNVTSCSDSPVPGDIETPDQVHGGQCPLDKEDPVPTFDMDSSILVSTQ